MTEFTYHDLESADEASRKRLEISQKAFGMIPNLHAVMAESPEHLEGYQTLHELFQKTSLSTVEQNVVWLTINVRHNCHYCVPAHTGIAKNQGVSDEVINALREGRRLNDPKLEALRQFTLQVVDKRGEVTDAEVQAFLNAGFIRRNILDVILGLAQKVMSNYVNHLVQTKIDEPFKQFAWEKPAKAA